MRTASPNRREESYAMNRSIPARISIRKPVASKDQTFWHASRRPSSQPEDAGTEIYISLVDSSGNASKTGSETLTVRCTCTNRDLPDVCPSAMSMAISIWRGDRLSSACMSLRKPTETVRPPLRKAIQWRLISHLSLNYLSLVEGGRGALQEILRLYNFTESRALERQISGITDLQSERHFARVASEHGISFARGIRVHMEFDEEYYVGNGVYLFASVLEYFLGLYSSLNSFSQLVTERGSGRRCFAHGNHEPGRKSCCSVSRTERRLFAEPYCFRVRADRSFAETFQSERPAASVCFEPPETEVVRFGVQCVHRLSC